MINIKKGTGLSLAQTDTVGLAKAGNGIVAGMLCYIDASGYVTKVVAENDNATIASKVVGFALNTQPNSTGGVGTDGADPANLGDGDVIASGKIGLILLDGGSIIETDQYSGALSTFTAGVKVYAAQGGETAGTISATSTATGKLIGICQGTRYLPARRAGSQAYIDYLPYNYDGTSANNSGAGTTITNSQTLQKTAGMVAVKLSAN